MLGYLSGGLTVLVLGFKELNCEWLIMSHVTESVWRFGFADVTFRVEKSEDRKYVCVSRLGS